MKAAKNLRQVQVLPIRNYVMKGVHNQNKKNTVSEKNDRFINIQHLRLMKAHQNIDDNRSEISLSMCKNANFDRFKSYLSFQKYQTDIIPMKKSSDKIQSYQKPRQIGESTQIRSLKNLITNNNLKIPNYFPQRKTKKNNILRKQIMQSLQTPTKSFKPSFSLIIQYKQQTISPLTSIEKKKPQSANIRFRPSSKPSYAYKKSERSHSFSQICPWNTTSIQIVNAEEITK